MLVTGAASPVRAILTSGSDSVALFCFNPLIWATGVE